MVSLDEKFFILMKSTFSFMVISLSWLLTDWEDILCFLLEAL